MGVILIYVAFSVIWRVCFNSPAEGAVAGLEIAIDIFFGLDIVLNLHTAYYDNAGELVGVASTSGIWYILGCGTGADLRRTYANYIRGWFVVRDSSCSLLLYNV